MELSISHSDDRQLIIKKLPLISRKFSGKQGDFCVAKQSTAAAAAQFLLRLIALLVLHLKLLGNVVGNSVLLIKQMFWRRADISADNSLVNDNGGVYGNHLKNPVKDQISKEISDSN
ncbi:Uncharacterized protein Adt_44058 [Abeliophyllum distichum]|uniref:Uncharacterized protein n=1 Tax=Abeliophyllum distichum TaxID=126358 RepID=A0ABD1P9S8_9LAMI